MKVIQQSEWTTLLQSINNKGYARVPGLLSDDECKTLIQQYDDPSRYRSVISMERYRFGSGEYKYFNYPLPSIAHQLRDNFYPALSVLANSWFSQLAMPLRFPARHATFIETCHLAGQTRPTPLILRYGTGGFNTLHQDLYGEIYFPFQLVIVLTHEGTEHCGGEFVLTEQLPRAQSKATVISPALGEGIIFTTNFRPVTGKRGSYRVKMKHGISEVTDGTRYALGIIFHDAT
jgi:hypothetical protein